MTCFMEAEKVSSTDVNPPLGFLRLGVIWALTLWTILLRFVMVGLLQR